MTAMLTDAHWAGAWLLGALVIWAITAVPVSLLVGRLLKDTPPTLGDQLRAARSEPVDAETLAREMGLR
jgi:hypothetical protein